MPKLRKLDLDEKVLKIAETFIAADVPHSFGGAIALAYYAHPRPTYDIDINVYVPVDAASMVIDAITPLGVEGLDAATSQGLKNSGQVRLFWQGTPLDLFFSNLPFHDRCMERRTQERYGESHIHILSPEDLVVCKVAFGRPKDKVDIRAMFEATGDEFDLDYVRKWVADFLAPDDDRYVDLELAIREYGLGD